MARIVWHSCCPWSPSGYGQQTAIWTKELVKMGHEVIISSYWGLQGAPMIWEDGITILPGFGQNYCSTSLGQHCNYVQPDLVITLGDIWVLDPKVVAELPIAHWLPVDTRPQSLADRNLIEQTGSGLIAMSRFGYDRMKQAGYNPLYVPHAINTEIFKPANDFGKLREQCQLSESTFVIGINAANNDAIRKGATEQLLAFAKFASMYPDSILSLHTGVHQEGGQDLEALAENLGITDMVRVVDQYRYTAGLISASDMAEWYRVIDVLSEATYAEGFGLPIIEAQACETPVITTDASSMTELNPHGIIIGGDPFWNGVHKGWWTRPSTREIVAAYEHSYHNRNLVPRDKLRKFAVENYDVNYVAKTYMEPAISELLERVKKRR